MAEPTEFDFDAYHEKAEIDYRRVRALYEDFSKEVERILEITLDIPGINVHEFQSRAKTIESFLKKVKKRSKLDPSQPKYPSPLQEITDLAGVRVIAFFPKNLEEIEKLIRDAEFRINERRDIGEERFEEGHFGYQSIHLLVELPEKRKQLKENEKFGNFICEIQVRTIMQHAWAEMEHDIQYKSSDEIPAILRRRFLALAGMIEIADREFQAIQDEDSKLKQSVKSSLEDELTENFGETTGEEPTLKFGETVEDVIGEALTEIVENNKKESSAFSKMTEIERQKYTTVNSKSARALVARGKYDAAISLYNEKIAWKPSDHLLYAGRSKARFLAGDTKGAIEDINKAIAGVPDDVRLQNLKEQYAEGSVAKAPTVDAWTLANEGNALLMEGNAEEAFGKYSKAQELGFSHSSSTFNKAMARILSHDCDGASFFIDQLFIFSESAMEYNILGLRAIIASACNMAQAKKFRELKKRFEEGKFNFDFSQSPLRRLEQGYIARDGNIKDTVQKVFDLLKGNS